MRIVDRAGHCLRHHCICFCALLVFGSASVSRFAAAQTPVEKLETASVSTPPGDVLLPEAPLPEAPEPEAGAALNGAGNAASLRPVFVPAANMPEPWSADIAPGTSERVPSSKCPRDTTHARECRVHWRPLIISSAAFMAVLSAGN